jgi:FlaA1/EpsC-like NDP-sugar epimerase
MKLNLSLLSSNANTRLALRGRHLLVIDALCIVFAFVLAFALRLDAPSPEFHDSLVKYFWLVLPLLAIRIGVNMLFRLYQRLWRYASIEEMQAIVLSTVTGSLLFGVLLLALGFGGSGWLAYGFPRSIVGIELLLSTALLGGSRFSLRAIRVGRQVNSQIVRSHQASRPKRVLIVGAGDAGAMVAREMEMRPRLGMKPIGFVDDDPAKHGKWIHGVQVLGGHLNLRRLVGQLQIDGVIVAMPSAPGTAIREVLRSCEAIGVSVLTVPGIAELISGKVSVSHIRPVEVGDLLRREPTSIDMEAISGFIRGATVLITGAGGSIGSELCRQLAPFGPERMLLLGRGENSIHQIQMEMESRYGEEIDLVPVIADVRDMPRLKAVFAVHQPSVVFHAAAHKHVPLMELNPSEAVAVNVFGTRNLLQASEELGVDSFVLVSTDKAVNPSNVMGTTKRIAELLLQETATRTGRRYLAVRFGNVLGSRGSVVPLFKQQIATGGPVTITHPDITRYFMTIPEGVQLIIQAAAMGRGGEIFVLDMGTPVRIYDLALDLIHLSGLEPHTDIEIKLTGLRPGEKLHEEIFTPDEERTSTRNSRIFISSLGGCQTNRLECGLERLADLLASGSADEAGLRETLAWVVPEFSSAR